MKIFHTTIHKDYVLGWGFSEAMRELFQNGLDQGNMRLEGGVNYISIVNEGASLTEDTLYLGSTTKQSDASKIGQYGEGYKLACLVLLRIGYTVNIHAGDDLWTPVIIKSHAHENVEVLAFEIHYGEVEKNTGVEFVVSGVSDYDKALIGDIYLGNIESIEKLSTKYGEVLLHKEYKGKVYLGGLFVMHSADLHYGYNILPEYLSLERDRNTLNDFDLHWVLKDLWLAASYEGDGLEIAVDLVFESAPDIRFIHNAAVHKDHPLIQSIYDMFVLLYGKDFIVVEHQREADALGYSGLGLIVNPGPLGQLLRHHSGYSAKMPEPRYKPTQQLLNFYRQNKKYMKRAAQVEFKKLIKKSGDWRE